MIINVIEWNIKDSELLTQKDSDIKFCIKSVYEHDELRGFWQCPSDGDSDITFFHVGIPTISVSSPPWGIMMTGVLSMCVILQTYKFQTHLFCSTHLHMFHAIDVSFIILWSSTLYYTHL